MNDHNARRIQARLEVERLRIPESAVEQYERIHYPEHFTPERLERVKHILRIPGNRYVAKLDHARFHDWFGTTCDETCPHPKEPARKSWWRRLLRL